MKSLSAEKTDELRGSRYYLEKVLKVKDTNDQLERRIAQEEQDLVALVKQAEEKNAELTEMKFALKFGRALEQEMPRDATRQAQVAPKA
jgi:hypothetical protein